MSSSSLRSAWFVSSLSLFAFVACGGRTLGLDEDGASSAQAGAGNRPAAGGVGGASSSAGAGGGGGATGTAGTGASGAGGTGVGGSTTGKGGSGGSSGKAGAGGTTGKGGSGGGGGKGGKGGKGGTGGGSPQSCDQCQQQVYPMCAPLYDQCLNDPDCGGLLNCFDQCGPDDNCANDCFNTWNAGGQLYYELAGCFLCGSCEIPCDSPADFCDQFGGVNGGEPPQPGQPGPQ